MTARASRIRNQDLAEYTNTIAASDEAGGGVRYAVTSSLQVIADGSAVRYRRVGSTVRESDGSGLVGLNWLHSRGWIQANVSRFSPGETPTVNSPLQDRAGQFIAGEFDLVRQLRVFGGWEAFRSNLDASAALAAGFQLPRNSGTRQFGGVRTTIGSRSTMTFRAETGDRISKFDINRQDIQSDTGVLSADFQTAIGKMNGFSSRGAARQCHERQPRRLVHATRRLRTVLPAADAVDAGFWSRHRNANHRRGGRRQYLLAGWRRHADATRRQRAVAANRGNHQPQRRPPDALVRAP